MESRVMIIMLWNAINVLEISITTGNATTPVSEQHASVTVTG